MKKYIFVHGLAGWGSYDEKYAKKPYWGMRNGDLIQYLRDQGFDCYAASVSPHGSAWDRACELYAQLYGTRVDYGKRHSEEYGHERFGKDFSDCPLCTIEDETELILIGHSFGGTTIRVGRLGRRRPFSVLFGRRDRACPRHCHDRLTAERHNGL